jgi:hypothetical protein
VEGKRFKRGMQKMQMLLKSFFLTYNKKAPELSSALIVYMIEHQLMYHFFYVLLVIRLVGQPDNASIGMIFSGNPLILIEKGYIPARQLGIFKHWFKFKMLQHTNPPFASAFQYKGILCE